MGRWLLFALVATLGLATAADAEAVESLTLASVQPELLEADQVDRGGEADPADSDALAVNGPAGQTSLAPLLWSALPPYPAGQNAQEAQAAAGGSNETGAVPSTPLTAGNDETELLPDELEPILRTMGNMVSIPGTDPGTNVYQAEHGDPEEIVNAVVDPPPGPQPDEGSMKSLTPKPLDEADGAPKKESAPLSMPVVGDRSFNPSSVPGLDGSSPPGRPSHDAVAAAPQMKAPPGGPAWDLAPLFAALAVLAGMVSVIHVGSAFRGTRYIPWFGAALFAHVGKQDALKHTSRQAIHQLVVDTPGLSHLDLGRLAGLSRTAVGYHVDILERHGFVRSVRAGRSRRYYAVQADVEAEPHAMLLMGSQRAVAECVLMEPGIIQKRLCDALNIPPSRASERLKRLVQAGLVTTKPFRQAIRYYPTALLQGSLSGAAARQPVAVA